MFIERRDTNIQVLVLIAVIAVVEVAIAIVVTMAVEFCGRSRVNRCQGLNPTAITGSVVTMGCYY